MTEKKQLPAALPVHSKLGASSCERWWNCPGSVALIAKAPPQEPSEYAAEGTVAHALAAVMLESMVAEKQIPKEWRIGSIHEQDGFEIEITDEMFDAVNVYCEFVEGLIKKYNLHPDQILIEKRISISAIDENDESLYGTADFTAYIPYSKLVMADYKHGIGNKVDVYQNKQLLYYGLGSWLAMPEWMKETISEVEVWVVQPRCPGGGLSSFTCSVDELEAFHKELLSRADATKKPDAPLVAGEWCKKYYCNAQSICPAFSKKAVEDAFIDIQVPDNLPSVAGPSAFPAVADLDNDTLAKIAKSRSMANTFFNNVDAEIFRRLDLGQTVGDFKIVRSNPHRKWHSEADTIEKLQEVLGDEILKPQKLISPNAVEALIKSKKLKLDISQMWFKPEGERKLGSGSDNRKGRPPGAVEAFADVDVEALVVKGE